MHKIIPLNYLKLNLADEFKIIRITKFKIVDNYFKLVQQN